MQALAAAGASLSKKTKKMKMTPLHRAVFGAAAACLTMTLPAQLALGYVIGPSRRGIVALHGAVAWAQLCRQGPLWAAIAVAVKDEVSARRRRLL